MLEKLKLSSILDLITTGRMYGNQALPATRHFSGKNHNFNTHVKFTLIEQARHIDIDKAKNKERERENFWTY